MKDFDHGKKPVEEIKNIDGARLTHCFTIQSWYDNHSIVVIDDAHRHYRMKAEELIPLFSGHKFHAKKAIKHFYLSPEETPDIHDASHPLRQKAIRILEHLAELYGDETMFDERWYEYEDVIINILQQ